MKRFFWLCCLVIISTPVLAQQVSEFKQDSVKLITAENLAKKLKTDSLVLLDVRTDAEYDALHIDNALHIDVLKDDFLSKAQRALQKDKPVFVYCKTGKRAERAAKILKEAGFKEVISVEGGIEAWKKRKETEPTP